MGRDAKARRTAAMAGRAVGGSLLVAILVALIVTLVSLINPLWAPTYEPSARVLVDFHGHDGQRMYLAGGNELRTEERLMLTEALMRAAASRPVAEEVGRRLRLATGPDEFLGRLTVEQGERENLIILTYGGTDRRQATRVVNAVARTSADLVSERRAAGRDVTAFVKEAKVPEGTLEHKPLRNGLFTLALVWALLSGGTLALVAVLRR